MTWAMLRYVVAKWFGNVHLVRGVQAYRRTGTQTAACRQAGHTYMRTAVHAYRCIRRERQAGRYTMTDGDGETDRGSDRQTYRQTDRQMGRDIHTDRHTDRQTHRHTDRQADRQADR